MHPRARSAGHYTKPYLLGSFQCKAAKSRTNMVFTADNATYMIFHAGFRFKDPGHCGSGGYNLEVYRGTEGGYEFVSGTVRVFGPIRALPEHPYGWATLIVNLRDEGEILLRYNGKAYHLAPPPKVKATKAQISAAKTVIE